MNGSHVKRRSSDAPLRIGLICEAGMGNIGNDASFEAVLAYLRQEHPNAELDVLCATADNVRSRYQVKTTQMASYPQRRRVPRLASVALKIFCKAVDPLRIAAWVQGHDTVIVTGTGILDATLPIRPWGPPLVLFTASAASRLFGAKIAYVSVGAGPINQRLSRRLLYWAARLAHYRSFRDAASRAAVRKWGVPTERDSVYPDLAFYLPVPAAEVADPGIVCVGVMEYHGSNDDRRDADAIRQAYLAQMKSFVLWLLSEGRTVRLIIGDANGSDDEVTREIVDGVRGELSGLDDSRLVAQPIVTYADVLHEISLAGSVVGIRFHNVVAALMMARPTVALSYGIKTDSLMNDVGFPEFCVPVKGLTTDRLTRQLTLAESRAAEIRDVLAARREANAKLVAEQFATLSTRFIGH